MDAGTLALLLGLAFFVMVAITVGAQAWEPLNELVDQLRDWTSALLAAALAAAGNGARTRRRDDDET